MIRPAPAVDTAPEAPATGPAALFGPATEEVRRCWGTRPVRFRPGQRWQCLADLVLVEHWINTANLRTPYLRLFRDGAEIPATDYTRTRRVARENLPGHTDPAAVARLHRAGATLVLTALDDWHAPARAVAADLREATRCRTELTVFVTPPRGSGPARHADDADLAVLQLHGTKTWELSNPGDGPTDPQRVELTPGDGLYVPLGAPHRTTAGESASVHLTVSLRPPRTRDVLAVATSYARAAVLSADADGARSRAGGWDGAAPGFLPVDPARRCAVVADLVAAVAARLAALDPAEVLAAVEERAGCAPPRWYRLDPGKE